MVKEVVAEKVIEVKESIEESKIETLTTETAEETKVESARDSETLEDSVQADLDEGGDVPAEDNRAS